MTAALCASAGAQNSCIPLTIAAKLPLRLDDRLREIAKGPSVPDRGVRVDVERKVSRRIADDAPGLADYTLYSEILDLVHKDDAHAMLARVVPTLGRVLSTANANLNCAAWIDSTGLDSSPEGGAMHDLAAGKAVPRVGM